MTLAPAVGLALGALLAGVAWCLTKAGFTPLPTAAVLVALLAGLTRGLHLDGLADTVDALASYRDRDAALAIMKSPEVGPLGSAAVACALIAQCAALGTLIGQRHWLAIILAVGVGRTAICLCCRRGVPAARPGGLGATVAGTVPLSSCLLWSAAAIAVLSWDLDRHWAGGCAVIVALGCVLVLLRHVARRIGGVTGDVIGASCELATTVALLIVSAG